VLIRIEQLAIRLQTSMVVNEKLESARAICRLAVAGAKLLCLHPDRTTSSKGHLTRGRTAFLLQIMKEAQVARRSNR
jgi:hypothetical protein